ncbi:transcriptional regulator, IclR family [Halomicrobium zhouii]|uniref:Transcriptional regulator, IclR family n=1 Tax=Halomicrobium zhouii TaxID=767519 RepID=A0A1I6KK23_9EURY|nr:IclR family transcriptional regulator [Halomicrobium zhouii]SFR91539.1 transcriptional regulator, IclR family [Halomicrobium zhouii]
MGPSATNPVKSIEAMFTIVEALKELDGAGVTELADHLELPKSTIHNYLATLEQEEYVVKEGTTYRVGLRFLDLGAYARDQVEMFEVAKPELEHLASETGELANLLVEEHGKGSYLYRTRGEMAVQVKGHVGTRAPLHSTGLGKAILAHLPEERVEAIVDHHGMPASTPETITDRDELFDELKRIRDRGFAFDDEERLRGLRCVAAPILANDDVVGAISVSGPTNRLRDTRYREELPQKLLEVQNVIELNVTYS